MFQNAKFKIQKENFKKWPHWPYIHITPTDDIESWTQSPKSWRSVECEGYGADKMICVLLSILLIFSIEVVQRLGLNSLGQFNPKERIIEWVNIN